MTRHSTTSARRGQSEVTKRSLLFGPSFGLKRWLVATVTGIVLMAVGLAIFLSWLLRDGLLGPLMYLMALEFLPDWLQGLLLLCAGLALSIAGALHLYRTVTRDLWPELKTPEGRRIIRSLLQRQQRRVGPRVVAIGGGTGLPQLLRGLRQYTDNITAIVTVADDGGSSGRLRRQIGMLPPGDFRNNIAALSEAEGLMTRLFQYRFAEADIDATDEQSELSGHSFGNLFITTMAAITGSFESGIAESSKVLAVRGRVLPSTLENVTLCAEVRWTREDGREEWYVVEGESKLPKTGGQIERVYLQPANARGYPEAIRAILQADLIVAGPGSFFTSVMPNLLVGAVRDAICASIAPRIYVCNVATQPGETDDFTVTDHMRQLRLHAGDAFTMVLANDNYDPTQRLSEHSDWVRLPEPGAPLDYELFTGDLIEERRPWRHDSDKLAARLMDIYVQLQTRPQFQENGRMGKR